MRNVLMSIAFSLGLSACATQPVSFATARPVEPSKVMDIGEGSAQILVKRDAGMVGSACDTRIYVNGKLRALLGAGEVVRLRSNPGSVVIGAEPNGTFCGGNLKEVAGVAEAEREARFRVLIDQSASMSVVQTATD
ncbi:hypothetical protein [Chromobacterium violaceum]|uniref:hypothetical protein n=1 Tax=Chromobacterium violaceum TaxID=536 RepID=UPI0012D49272|nr:hypothetical protein [Chromobacterium violaceum]